MPEKSNGNSPETPPSVEYFFKMRPASDPNRFSGAPRPSLEHQIALGRAGTAGALRPVVEQGAPESDTNGTEPVEDSSVTET